MLERDHCAPAASASLKELSAAQTTRKVSLGCDFRYTYPDFGDLAIERLIVRTAVKRNLGVRRSAQRFEQNTYHGDALPTELRGQCFSCLTGVLCLGAVNSGRAHRPYEVSAPGLGELTVLLASWCLRLAVHATGSRGSRPAPAKEPPDPRTAVQLGGALPAYRWVARGHRRWPATGPVRLARARVLENLVPVGRRHRVPTMSSGCLRRRSMRRINSKDAPNSGF
jgi:hypothetical protein